MSNQKLEIMDDLLSEGKEILNPDKFAELVNKKLSIGERPIKRDMVNKLIRELREMANDKGIKLEYKKNRGYFYDSVVHDRIRVFDKRVNDEDKDLLLIANCLFSLFPGSSMIDQFSIMVNTKILSKQKTEINNKLINSVQLSNIHQDPGAKWISSIIKAMREQEAIEVQYSKPTQTGLDITKRTLSPYIIRHHQSEWYLIAYDHFTEHIDKTKTFKLSRIDELSISGHSYFIDYTFSAEDYFKYTIGIHHRHLMKPIKVKICVLNKELYENFKETPFHSTQQVVDEAKRIIEIEVFDTFELDSLILSYGSNLKVLSPASLQKKIKDKLTKTLSFYK